VFGIVGYSEVEFRSQKHAVLSATSDYADRLMIVGQHLVVGYEDSDEISELVRQGFIAGIFVTHRNAKGKTFEQLHTELNNFQTLRREAGLPPLMIATDQEGGSVSRLSPPLPRLPTLAALLTPDLTDAQIEQNATAYGVEQGKALVMLGVNTNFSPVVDLKTNRQSGTLDFHTRIAERAIAAEPEIVTRVALAYSRGLLTQNVMPAVKHFPGLGSVADDTHHFSARLSLPLSELEQRDWYPFRTILSQSPAMLMVGHVIVDAVDPEFPASLSYKLLTGIVRETWKHNGVLISDDMTMAAVYNRGLCESSIRSLNAGVDLLLVAYDWEKVYPVLDCLARADKSGQFKGLQASRERLDRLSWQSGDLKQ
jgi:beta-N-acetylhexosaminidase